jgi:hypothetical protein
LEKGRGRAEEKRKGKKGCFQNPAVRRGYNFDTGSNIEFFPFPVSGSSLLTGDYVRYFFTTVN